MELWLLVAGAVVLIAITVWIVWPGTNRSEESAAMDDNARRSMPPQGDKFEDQYTAATADLSVGGVAGAMEEMQSEASEATSDTAKAAESWSQTTTTQAREGIAGVTGQARDFTSTQSRQIDLRQPKTIGLGAGVLMAAGGAVGGAWLYSRWQAERNKPINRLRRGALGMALRVGERLPDTVALPDRAAPVGGGAAAALLLSGVVLARALRREDPAVTQTQRARALLQELVDTTREQRAPAAAELTRSVVHDLLKTSRRQAERLPTRHEVRQIVLHELEHAVDASRKQADHLPGFETRRGLLDRLPSGADLRKTAEAQPKGVGIGLGGLVAIASSAFIIWRLLRGGSQSNEPIYR
jgi:hypothetical protein